MCHSLIDTWTVILYKDTNSNASAAQSISLIFHLLFICCCPPSCFASASSRRSSLPSWDQLQPISNYYGNEGCFIQSFICHQVFRNITMYPAGFTTGLCCAEQFCAVPCCLAVVVQESCWACVRKPLDKSVSIL